MNEPSPSDMAAARSQDLHQKASYLPDIHRLLPQSPDAEKGVLSSLLLAPREIGGICAEKHISHEHFHIPAHALLYRVIMELWDANKPQDFITITQLLRDRGQLDQAGGAAFITDLYTLLPTAANAGYYLAILEEKHTLREIIKTCTEYAARCYDEQDEVQLLLEGAEKDILSIRNTERGASNVVRAKDGVMAAVHAIEELYERRGRITGISTGLTELDKMLDGLHKQEMIIIAARPSMGKTALAMNIAEHIAADVKLPVAVFSLEMSSSQLFQRLLCSRAKVNMHRVREGSLAERDFPALTAAASSLAESCLLVDDSAGISIIELKARARRMHQQYGLAAIVVDYLQLLKSTSKQAQNNREREISEISSGLKELAKELDIPIIVLAQLSRKPDERTNKRPKLSDLRESGSIEQDADVVGLLVREEYYAENDEDKLECEGKATLIIAKQRNGPVGDVPLTFLKEFARFENRAWEPPAEETPRPPRENPRRNRRSDQ